MHATPTSGSLMNIKNFFGVIIGQAICRAPFTSIKKTHRRDIDPHRRVKDRCQLFTWTKTADQNLNKARPR
jgi:hypothetical protein